MASRTVAFACLLGAVLLGGRVLAAGDDSAAMPKDVEALVAKELFQQAVRLFDGGRFADARRLFAEAARRDGDGPYAVTARVMIQRCDEVLGVATERSGPPSVAPEPAAASAHEELAPADPYAASPAVDDATLDPYAPTPQAVDVEEPEVDASTVQRGSPGVGRNWTRLELLIFGGSYGFWSGLSLGVASGSPGATPLLFLGGGALGVGAAHLATRSGSVSEGQAMATMSGAAWGATLGLLLGHVADDPNDEYDQSAEGYFASTLIASSVGFGGGVAYAVLAHPSAGDVALVNSLTEYGLVTGLVVGGMMQPAENRAYSLNAVVGSAGGMLAGFLLAPHLEISRGRLAWVDLGALSGVTAAALFAFPAIEDGSVGAARAKFVVALGAMATGGYLAWRWTRGEPAARLGHGPLSPALVAYGERGWGLGLPMLHPVAEAGWSLGLDVLAGRF